MENQKSRKPRGKENPLQTANSIVLEQTSLDLGLPLDLVTEVVKAQAEFTAFKIREGMFEGVMWPRLGKIKIKVSKVHNVNKYRGLEDVIKNTETR